MEVTEYGFEIPTLEQKRAVTTLLELLDAHMRWQMEPEGSPLERSLATKRDSLAMLMDVEGMDVDMASQAVLEAVISMMLAFGTAEDEIQTVIKFAKIRKEQEGR